jgi:hypothetical protein
MGGDVKTTIEINGILFHIRAIDETHVAFHIYEDRLDYSHCSIYHVGQFDDVTRKQVVAFLDKAFKG